jgi:tetratricopeptide (TPR) repeat protein
VALHYFKSFFLPTELSADTDWTTVPGPLTTEAVVGYLFVVLLLAIAVKTSRRRELRPIAFGIGWFFLALLPTSLVPLAEVTNDHRMFFPFVGLALAVFWALRVALFSRTARLSVPSGWLRAAALVFAVVLAAESMGTYQRNNVWHSDESLWRDVTIKSPHNGRGLMNYGLVFLPRADYAQALSYFERALPFTPNYSTLEINLGIALGGLGRTAEAEQHFHRAIELAPNSADAYFFYGRWLCSVGRRADCTIALQAALAKDPLHLGAKDLMTRLYAEQRN